MSDSRTPLSAFLGMLLCRALVPLWVLTGAVFKLIERDPTLLPKNIIDATKIVARRFEEPTAVLDFVLRSFIGLELVVVVLMVLMARWARPVAIFMLGAFCLVLIGEMVTGNFENCGCFGDLPVTPWQMLIADGTLLLGAIFLGPAERPPAATFKRILVAAVLTLAAFGTSFGMPGRTVVAPPVDGNGGETPPPPDADGCPPLPGRPALDTMYWPIYENWIGECWTETELAPHARPLPKDFGKGTWYVLFYRKDCEHCHELMARFFTGTLSIRTVAIAVPEPEGFPDAFDDLGMPCTDCVQRELPVGPNYVMSTPVLVRVEEGIVQCAAEVDAKADLPKCIIH